MMQGTGIFRDPSSMFDYFMTYHVVSMKDPRFGVPTDGITDATAAMQSVINTYPAIRIPDGTYVVSQLNVPSNRSIITNGAMVTLQSTAQTGQTAVPILNIQGSNIVIGAMSYIGNINTATGEWGHAVAFDSTKTIANVVIEGVYASNVRGDAVGIGGVGANKPTNITIKNVVANNMYRHGVSVTGGSNITIEHLNLSAIGINGIDLESDTQGGVISGVMIGNYIGPAINIVGTATNPTTRVRIERAVMDQTYYGSTPAYTGVTVSNGCTLRNARRIVFEQCEIQNWNSRAITGILSGGDIYLENIEIRNSHFKNNCVTEATYTHYINVSCMDDTVEIDGCTFDMPNANIDVIMGASSGSTVSQVNFKNSIVNGGRNVFYYVRANAENITLNSAVNLGTQLKAGSEFHNVQGTLTNVLTYSVPCILKNCNITYSGYKYDSNHAFHIEENNTWNGVQMPRHFWGAAAPTSANWNQGDYMENTNPTLQGASGSQYVIHGWRNVRTGQAAPAWAASQSVALNEYLVASPDNGHVYKCTTVGGTPNTGTIQPTWNTGSGSTTTDANGNIWTESGSSVLFQPNRGLTGT